MKTDMYYIFDPMNDRWAVLFDPLYAILRFGKIGGHKSDAGKFTTNEVRQITGLRTGLLTEYAGTVEK